MNNRLPMFFSSMTPQLSVACARYELRNPKSHLPTIKHKYAENSIRYCLIRQLNSDSRGDSGGTGRFSPDAILFI